MLKIKRLRPEARLPETATPASAGYDLCALNETPEEVLPGETRGFPTGLAMQIEPGYGGFVFARSGLAVKHGLVPANCVGVIDSDYRGEVWVFLHNLSDKAYTITGGDRIAQLVLLPVHTPQVVEVAELADSVRGDGGFGSTGK